MEYAERKYLLDGFELILSGSGDFAHIVIKNPISQTVHACSINDHAAQIYSLGHFSSAESLLRGLVNAVEGKQKGVSVCIEDGAKIHYTLTQGFGDFKWNAKFVIPVPQKKGTITVLDSQMLKKSQTSFSQNPFASQHFNGSQKEKDEMIRIINEMKFAFHRFERTVFDRLKSLENRVSKIEDKLEGITFKPNQKNSEFFTFSNSNKTIQYKGNDAFRSLFGQKRIEKNKSFSFSLNIEILADNNLIVGIAPSQYISQDSCYNKEAVYAYFSKGRIWKDKACSSPKSSVAATKGDVVSLYVDLSTGTISFELNGNVIHEEVIEKKFLEQYEYYPFVELYNEGDKVSFL